MGLKRIKVYKSNKLIAFFFCLLLFFGCSKREADLPPYHEVAGFSREDFIGEWEWVETHLYEFEYPNTLISSTVIPPHKRFKMTYFKNGKVEIIQDEIPNGQKYNSYFTSWQLSYRGAISNREIYFQLILNRPFKLSQMKDYEFKYVNGFFVNDLIRLSSYDHPYFGKPHPDPTKRFYTTGVILRKVGG